MSVEPYPIRSEASRRSSHAACFSGSARGRSPRNRYGNKIVVDTWDLFRRVGSSRYSKVAFTRAKPVSCFGRRIEMKVSPGLSSGMSLTTSNPCRYCSPSMMRTTSHSLLLTFTACAVPSPSLRHCTSKFGLLRLQGKIRCGSHSGNFFGTIARWLMEAFPRVCHGHQMVKKAATVETPANTADSTADTSFAFIHESLALADGGEE